MRSPATLTREQFDAACRSLVELDISGVNGSLSYLPLNWMWKEHSKYSGFGYLYRTVSFQDRGNTEPSSSELDNGGVEDFEDRATIPMMGSSSQISIDQYVVFSNTFRVPSFYFNAYYADGTPLSLLDLVQTSFMRHTVSIPNACTSPSQSILLPQIGEDSVPFPLLTRGDHPTTGAPCWYIHPCETSAAVKELMDEIVGDEWDETNPEKGLLRWFGLWFMVLGSVLNLVSLPFPWARGL
ncbi:hypothetical protein BS47DRAFT_1337112, partial [Hydnum rufescens UP504]